MSLFDMPGKVAVITGSSRGIGKAIAEEMAVHGARVVISSRKQEPCDAAAAAINAKHGAGTAISVPANISSKEILQQLVDKTRQAFGRIDALVCNAASNPYYGPLAGIAALHDAMQKAHPQLTRQTTMWRAWVGFNASHSMGAILFGLIYIHLAVWHASLLLGSPFLCGLGVLVLLGYLWLGWRYWFSVPFRGIAIATLLFVAGVGVGLWA